MVDREARRQLAEALRQLVTGRITNDEFEELWPEVCNDSAVEGVRGFGWSLYSDTHPYRLRGIHRVSPETRKMAARAVLFLRSDREYEWPALPERAWISYLLFSPTVLLFGIGIIAWLRGFESEVYFLWAGVWACLSQLMEYARCLLPESKAMRDWKKTGEYDMWPFINRADFEAAKRRHHFFAGPRS